MAQASTQARGNSGQPRRRPRKPVGRLTGGGPSMGRGSRGWRFVAPAALTLVLVLGLPVVVAIGTSLVSRQGGFTLDHYARLASDPRFLNALVVTFTFIVGTVTLHLLVGGAVAFALHSQLRARNFWRVAMILPWTLPDVISGLVWRFMYNPTAGVINGVINRLGLYDGYIEWLSDPTLALISVIFADVWRGYPFAMVILLAGLQSTSKVLSEAAKIDGTRWWQELWYVTLPQLRGVILIAAALDTIWQFRRFGLVYNMTGGGPGNATEILSLYIYKVYFEFFEYEYASAIAVTLAVIMFVISLPYVRSTVRREK